MDQAEAMQHLQIMMTSFQRYRSIVRENMTNLLPEDALATMYPWVFGTKCPLTALQKVLDRGSVTGTELYNFMYIVDKFAPEIKIIRLIETQTKFPEPDIDWVTELGL